MFFGKPDVRRGAFSGSHRAREARFDFLAWGDADCNGAAHVAFPPVIDGVPKIRQKLFQRLEGVWQLLLAAMNVV